jgi:hypothetical protein
MRVIEFDKGNSDHDQERKINPDEEEKSVGPRFRSCFHAEDIEKGKSAAAALQNSANTKGGEKGVSQYTVLEKGGTKKWTRAAQDQRIVKWKRAEREKGEKGGSTEFILPPT